MSYEKVQNIKQMKWSCSVRGRSEETGADPPGQMIAVSFPWVWGAGRDTSRVPRR